MLRLLLALLVLLDGGLCYAVLVDGQEFYRENGLMENLQALLLVMGILVFAFYGFSLQGRDRVLSAFFSLLCFIFLFRELDVDRMVDVPQILVFLMADNRGRAIFVLAELVLLVMLAKDFRHFLTCRSLYLRSNLFLFLALSAVLLLVFSNLFDRKWVRLHPQAFFEEITEVTAYYFLFIAAVMSRSELRSIAAASSSRSESR